jgi:hypothetical protein
MRRGASLLAIGSLLATMTCAPVKPPVSPQASPPPAAPSAVAPIEEGSTLQAAVLVPATDEDAGVQWENDWIYFHYGRFRKRSAGLAALSGRRYDVITVELSDHTTRTIYFDITRFYGRESK